MLVLLTVVGCAQRPSHPAGQTAFEPIPLPDFRLVERGGDVVTRDDLRGDIWVSSFVFTRCAGPCPRVSATMARLHKELDGLDGVRLVTFTVDPEHDTPEVLRRYADQFQADQRRWLFLTGEEDQIHRVIREGFKLNREPQPDMPPGERIEHDTRLVLVDREAQIVGFFDGLPGAGGQDAFEENFDRLVARVREMAVAD